MRGRAGTVLLVSVAALALATAGCGDGGGGSSSPTASSAPLEDAPAISVHPVLGSAPCGTDDTATVPDRTHGRCYRLGPAFILQGDLENPRVDVVDGGFSVVVDIAEAARERVDVGLEACRLAAETCPASDGDHGTAAVVIDRVVEAAPPIEAADVIDAGLALRGDLTEDDAYRIVDSLMR